MNDTLLTQRITGGPTHVERIVIKLGRPLRRRLSRRRQKTQDAGLATRISIILHFDSGLGSVAISRALHCAPATAVRVAHRFLAMGEPGLLDGRRANGRRKVDSDSLQALAELVETLPSEHGWTRPTWTKESLARTLNDLLDLEVSISTVSRMLRQLGARWRMPKPVVNCPWSRRRRQARLRKIRLALASLGPDEVAYYEDEVDIHLNPKVGRDWMLPGRRKLVVTPGRNAKHYVAGALATDGSDLICVEGDRKNTDLFLALLDELRRRNRSASRIHLVVDNYCIHSSRRAQTYLLEHAPLIELHFLPPYCPDDNKIERDWLDLHANVTRNHRHANIQELRRAVWSWLKSDAAGRRARARRQASAARRAA